MCRQAGLAPDVRHETDLMTTVFLLVESGLGVSLVPSRARGLEQQKTLRRPLTVQSNSLCLCAIWPRQISKSNGRSFSRGLASTNTGYSETGARALNVRSER